MNSGVGDGRGGLACCNSWGHKESDTTTAENTEWRYVLDLLDSILFDAIDGEKYEEEGNYPTMDISDTNNTLSLWRLWS